MKKLISIILSISILMMSTIGVLADETVDTLNTNITAGDDSEQLQDQDVSLDEEVSDWEQVILEEPEEELNPEETIPPEEDVEISEPSEDEEEGENETEVTEDGTEEESDVPENTDDPEGTLDEKVNDYLETFPEDSADKQMFLREIELLKFSDSYTEEEVDKVYDRFKPIDISSLPEIEPVEIPDEEIEVDESSVIRISEEERERNGEENQRLLDWYAEMMEGMTDEEAVEMGINEEIIHLVRLRELQELEEPVSEEVGNITSRPMSVQSHPSSSSNTTSKAPMIASGDYHNVYLKGDGTVWTWGNYNAYAALKQTADIYMVPIPIEMLTNIIEVAAIDNYSLALSSSGVVYAWGAYTGTGYGSREPIIVSGLSDIISIDAGSKKSLALKADGTVYEWTTGTFCAKQVMQSANTPLTGVKAVAAGDRILYALKTDGTVVAWNYDDIQNGNYPITIQDVNNAIDISTSDQRFLLLTAEGYVYQLYNQTNIDNLNLELVTLAGDNELVSSGIPISDVKEIYTGTYNGAMVTGDGSVYIVGAARSYYYQYAMLLDNISNVVSFSFGYDHIVAVKNDGSIWTTGYNDNCQLGIGNRNWIRYCATQIYSDADVKQVDIGVHSYAILKGDTTVSTWGDILEYQYGYTAGELKTKPMHVVDMNGNILTNVDMIQIGNNNALALKDGMVWSWGSNTYNILGRGSYEALNKAAPVRTNASGNPYLTDIISISISESFAMALDENGDVWVWGRNNSGQLGLGNTTDQPYATKITTISNIKEISCGLSHAMALDNNGNVWAWGRNGSGQLGIGSNINKNTPQMLNSINNIKSISSGGSHSMALGEDGYVWTWGYNYNGQLGNNSNNSSNIPIKLSLNNIKQISAGNNHSLALNFDGSIWAWGIGFSLGNKDMYAKNYPVKVLVDNGELKNVASISAGGDYNLALKNNGSVWGWGIKGYTSDETLGDGNTFYEEGWIPVMNITPKIVQATSKYGHSLVLKSDGTVWASGDNDSGQLGNTTLDYENIATPVQVMGVSGDGYLDNIVEITTSEDASLALTGDGRVLAWGKNEDGKLGQVPMTSAYLFTPTYVRGVGGTGELSDIVSIAAGTGYTLALSSDGTVYAWGSNDFGQLGDGSVNDSSSPIEVTGPSDIIAISAYDKHSIALKSDGTVWAWGANDLGQIGNGSSTTIQNTPVQVKTSASEYLTDVKKISVGYNHNAALKSDGTVWVWGHNNCGQLGDGSTDSSPYAICVPDISNVSAIAAGMYTTFAITDGDVLKAWGYNVDGRLGDDSTATRLTPVSVSTSEKIKTVDSSNGSTAAITTDGTLLMWGNNTHGLFGIGSMGNISLVPVPAYTTGITYNDYGQSFAGAEEIAPNKIVPGEIAEEEEADYFKFTADFTGKHTIDVTGDVTVELYDSSQSLMLPLNMAYTLTAGETYYIRVTSDVTSTYTFIIRSTDPDPFFARYSFKSGFINPTEITSLTSGHVEGHLVVANDYIEDRNVLVALTLYNKETNALHGVDIVEKTIPARTSETIIMGLEVPSNCEDYVMKAIIWDSREDMNQLGEEIIFE